MAALIREQSQMCVITVAFVWDVFPLRLISVTEVPVGKTNPSCRLCKGRVRQQLSVLWNTVILLAFPTSLAVLLMGVSGAPDTAAFLLQLWCIFAPHSLVHLQCLLCFTNICFSFFQTVSHLTGSELRWLQDGERTQRKTHPCTNY